MVEFFNHTHTKNFYKSPQQNKKQNIYSHKVYINVVRY